MVLLLGMPFFFYGGPGAHGSRSFVALWDLGHVLFFFLASLWLFKYLQNCFPTRSIFVVSRNVFLIVLFLGFAIEGLQMCFSGDRSPDMVDILRNQLGCMIALNVYLVEKGYRRTLFRFVTFGFVCIALIPLILGAGDEWIARQQFPVISDFETSFEIDRWKAEGRLSVEKEIARNGIQSLKVRLTTDKYSGVSLQYVRENWRGYNHLLVSIYNPDDESLEIICRIHDSAHNNKYNDRFNRKFLLRKGWNDLVISIHEIENSLNGRLLNLDEVETIGFFVVEQERERVVYIDSVYLE